MATPLVLAALALICAAAAPRPAGAQAFDPRTGGGADGPNVSLTGDSLLNSAREETLEWLTPRYRVSQFAEGSRGLHDLQAHIASTARSLPDVYVIALGSNDLRFGASAFIPRIRQALDATAGVPMVLWVNVKEDGVPHLANWTAEARRFNAELRQQDAARGNLQVLDWNAEVRANPGWVAEDGLHLTPVGQRGYANLILRGVNASLVAAPSLPPGESGVPTPDAAAAVPEAVTAVPEAAAAAPEPPPGPATPSSPSSAPAAPPPGGGPIAGRPTFAG